MEFKNAFVDLGNKIIIKKTLLKDYDGDVKIEMTEIVKGIILITYIIMLMT